MSANEKIKNSHRSLEKVKNSHQSLEKIRNNAQSSEKSVSIYRKDRMRRGI